MKKKRNKIAKIKKQAVKFSDNSKINNKTLHFYNYCYFSFCSNNFSSEKFEKKTQ